MATESLEAGICDSSVMNDNILQMY